MASCTTKTKSGTEAEVQVSNVKPVFNEFKTAKYHKLTDFFIGEIFREYSDQLGWTPNDLTNQRNVSKLTKAIYTSYNNLLIDAAKERGESIYENVSNEAYIDIHDVLLPNFEQFIAHYYRYNSIVKHPDFTLDEDFFENEYVENSNSIEERESQDGDDPNDEDSNNESKDWDRAGNEKSGIELASKEVKTLFRLIPKAIWNEETQDVELFLDQDGLPTTADFGPVFNILLNKTSDTKDHEEFKAIFDNVDTLRVIPEAKYVKQLLKLDKPDHEKTRNEVGLNVKFYQVFSKPKIQIQSVLKQSNGNTLLIDEIAGNLFSIRQSFISNFQQGRIPQTMKQYVLKDELQGYYLSKEKFPEKPKTHNERLEFLGLLGIQFSGTDFLDSDSKREEFANLLANTTPFLYDSIEKRLKAGQIMREPVKNLRESFKPEGTDSKSIRSEAGNIDVLIAFEGRYSKIVPSLSARNSEGELQHLISLDNQLSIVTYHLNHAKTIDELYQTSTFKNAKYNPLFEASYFIKFLFDKNGNKIPGRTVSLDNLSGYKRQENKKNIQKLERKLSPKEKFVQDFALVLTQGKTDTMRTETSNSFFSISLRDNGKSRFYYAPNGFLTDFKSNSRFKLMVYDYLKAEIKRIKSYNKKKEENPTLPDDYKEFSIFYEAIQNAPARIDLRNELLSQPFEIDSPLFSNFMTAFQMEMNQEVENFKKEMDKLNITFDELISKNIKEGEATADVSNDALIRSFIANTWNQNVEFGIMYSGDPLFYKGQFHKRLKGLVSTGDLAAIIPLLDSFRASAYETNFHERYSITGAIGKNYRNNSKNFQTQTLKEYRQAPDFAYTQPEMVESIRKSILKRDGSNTLFTEDYIREQVLAEAAKQKPADGEAYISLDFHRELSYRFGFNTDELEVAYRYEGLIFRRDIKGQTLSTVEEQELDRLETMIYSSPENYGIPILKMTYFGTLENTTVDGKVYDKFSVAPLLPSDVKNHPKLSKLLTNMTMDQMGYVKYESGTKVFTTTPVDLDNILGAEHDLQMTELLKLQIKPKITQGTSTTIPTQFLKLIFSGLFNEGQPSNAKVKELYDKYINTLKGIQKIQAEKLMQELGISANAIDMTTLSTRLIKQAKAQGMVSNVISALQITPTKLADGSTVGSLSGALEESGFVKQIINLVSGIADDMLRRFEISGGDFILETNANRGKLKFYKYSETGTTACECRITLTKEYAKLLKKIDLRDGKPIGTLDRLNKLIKDPEFRRKNQKALRVVLDRVPTQGPNSMDFADIVEFLPPTRGNVIILPDEIVYKSGTDFDYDKEKVLTPSFTNQGDYISESNLRVLELELAQLEQEYTWIRDYAEQYDEEDRTEETAKAFLNKIFNNPLALDPNAQVGETLDELTEKLRSYEAIEKAKFSALANQIIDIYSEVLTQPEMFAELVIPNSTRTVKPIAENIGARMDKSVELPKNNRVFHYLENLKVKTTYFDAKNMLAPFAVDNTFMELMKYQGINLNKSYFRYGKVQAERTINHLILTPLEVNSITKGNTIKTSMKDDIEGYIKQHFDGENINATVDAAKDPWFALLGINYQNVGVVNLMKAMNYPFARIIDFINQPVLRRFYELQQNGLSKSNAIQQVGQELDIYRYEKKERTLPEKAYEKWKKDPDIEITDAKKLKTGNWAIKYSKKNKMSGWIMTNKVLIDIDMNKKLKSEYSNINTIMSNPTPINAETLREGVNGTIKPDYHNLRIFAHFILMDQHNQAFRNFQHYFKFDTTKTATPTDLKNKENQRQLLSEEGLYSEETLKNMEENSIIAPYINTEVMNRVFDGLFPIIGRDDVQQVLNSLYKAYSMNYSYRNQRDLRNMPTVLNADFITAIVFNYNIEDGESFIKRNRYLLIKEQGKRTLAERLEALRDQPFYKRLSTQFPVLESLIVNKHRIDFQRDMNGLKQYTVIDNIQMLKPQNETSIEAEGIIEQFRSLQNFKIRGYSKEKNKIYTEALQRFMKDLFTLGIVQSGIDASYLGYSNYIPFEFRRDLFRNALSNLTELPAASFSNFLANFRKQFNYNNPKYFPELKEGKSKFPNMNNYSARFKNYDIRVIMGDIQEATEEDEEEDDVPVVDVAISDMSKVKTAENILVAGKTVPGFGLLVKQYPGFKAYTYTDTKKQRFLYEPVSGKNIPISSPTIEKIIPQITEALESWMEASKSSGVLQSVSQFRIIQPEDKPGTTPSCGK